MQNLLDRKQIAILGSTGSIGKSALNVVKSHRDKFSISLLVANSNYELLAKQAVEFDVPEVVICNSIYLEKLRSILPDRIKCSSSTERIKEIIASSKVDLVLAAIIGVSSLPIILTAIEYGKQICLATKEIMVAAGDMVNKLLEKHQDSLIIPVDSEHSAIFQALANRKMFDVKRLILTSSGGPFQNYSMDELKKVTLSQALKHPVWAMGQKITIDSATMMNKALEVVEAHYLFKVAPEMIEVLIHKEAIIHSMIECKDNSNIAVLSLPSMELPIQYSFSYPKVFTSQVEPLNLAKIGSLNFAEVSELFKTPLNFAYESIRIGKTMGAIMNAANEVAVESFFKSKLEFSQIWSIVDKVMNSCEVLEQSSLENILQADSQARRLASEIIAKI